MASKNIEQNLSLKQKDFLPLAAYANLENIAAINIEDRMTLTLTALMQMLKLDATKGIDNNLLDTLIVQLDDALAITLDTVLHNNIFKTIEAKFKAMHGLVNSIPDGANVELELLDVTKEELQEDFTDALDITYSTLYKKIYTQEYDTPGANPVTVIISNFEFNNSAQDLQLLKHISNVGARAHCPFIANISPQFFMKDSFKEVLAIDNLSEYLQRPEYIKWNAFRETEDARFVGLCFPKVITRLPYGDDNPIKSFNYCEKPRDTDDYLWSSSSFAFAKNLIDCFIESGFLLNIRGPEAGGKIEDLPLISFDSGFGKEYAIPTEGLISETKELEFANLGFIPLSYYKNRDYACFFSASSVNAPITYDSKQATANAKINSRLPYVLLATRIAHYLKVIQRENIGSIKNASMLKNELERFLFKLVTKMKEPSSEQLAAFPLAAASVDVKPIIENPGFYTVDVAIKPHFQLEGIDVKLQLLTEIIAKD